MFSFYGLYYIYWTILFCPHFVNSVRSKGVKIEKK